MLVLLPAHWKRPPGHPRITCLKTVQNDVKSHNLTLTEALDRTQNCSLWRLLATFSTTHSSEWMNNEWIEWKEWMEWMNEWMNKSMNDSMNQWMNESSMPYMCSFSASKLNINFLMLPKYLQSLTEDITCSCCNHRNVPCRQSSTSPYCNC